MQILYYSASSPVTQELLFMAWCRLYYDCLAFCLVSSASDLCQAQRN